LPTSATALWCLPTLQKAVPAHDWRQDANLCCQPTRLIDFQRPALTDALARLRDASEYWPRKIILISVGAPVLTRKIRFHDLRQCEHSCDTTVNGPSDLLMIETDTNRARLASAYRPTFNWVPGYRSIGTVEPQDRPFTMGLGDIFVFRLQIGDPRHRSYSEAMAAGHAGLVAIRSM